MRPDRRSVLVHKITAIRECELARPFHVVRLCHHAQQVLSRCGVFRFPDSGHALVEDVLQALQALLLRLALLDLQEYLVIITDEIDGFVGFFRIHQVHVGLGHVALEGEERLVVATDLHQYLRLLSWADDDVAESQSTHADSHLARQP